MSRLENGMPEQRTEKGRAYDSFVKHVKGVADRGDERELAEWNERNANVLALKDLRPDTVHVDEVMTSMSVMFANDDFVGDRLMPTVFTNGSLSGVYYEYNQKDRLAYPDDEAIDRADANEIGEGRTKRAYALTARSLREYLDVMTIQNQSAPLNELLDAQANVMNGLEFRKELRTITTCTTAGNFGSNTVSLAASDRWDTSTGGDPGGVVDAATKEVWNGYGPGRKVAVASLSVYNVLKRHPRILDTFKYGIGSEGPKSANARMLADYFEVDDFVVGRARKDTANEASAASYSRMWPDIFGVFRVSTSPSLRNACWGYTIQDKPTQADLMFLNARGPKGAYMARCSRADQQKVISGFCGYLIQTPIG